MHGIWSVRRVGAVLIALLVMSVVAVAPRARAAQAPWSARGEDFPNVATELNVPIAVNEVVLRANVTWPADADGTRVKGTYPVLITQTPYKKGTGDVYPYLVKRGYVAIIVDVRGTGQSEGVYDGTFSTNEQSDAKAIVDWAAHPARDWNGGKTGSVGLFGGSYLGINQLLAAAQPEISPALKAIFPIVPNGDAYRTNFPGGYLTSLAAFALLYPANGVELPAYAAEDPYAAARTLGTRPAGLAAAAANVAGLAVGDNKTYDSNFIQSGSPLDKIDAIKVPTFIAGGWQDALSQRDAPLLYRELAKRGVPTKLVMGPWTHTNPGSGLGSSPGFPYTLDELHLRWFDHYVKGIKDKGLAAFGPVYLHRDGDDFRRANGWTVDGLTYRQAFLGAGTLRIADARPDDLAAGTETIVDNPIGGTCTRSTYVGTFGIPPPTPCTSDNQLNDRTTQNYDLPLTEDLKLTGPFAARLHVSTNGRDAYAVVRVEDVAPDGSVKELTVGWDTLSFRALDDAKSDKVGDLYVRPHHPYTKDSVLPTEANEVYEWWIEIRPTSVRIPVGHTLRLSIGTADTLRYLPTVRSTTERAGTVLTVHHDADHRSALILPVESG